MDWQGWALFGLLATAALTVVMIAAQMAGWTRLDLPLVLGTLVTPDPDKARVAGDEGAFLPCSFWLAQALALSGRVPEAAEIFEAVLEKAGPLGLFSEEIDPATGAFLGNYPQAMTHAALVQAALALRDAAAEDAPDELTAGGRLGLDNIHEF